MGSSDVQQCWCDHSHQSQWERCDGELPRAEQLDRAHLRDGDGPFSTHVVQVNRSGGEREGGKCERGGGMGEGGKV